MKNTLLSLVAVFVAAMATAQISGSVVDQTSKREISGRPGHISEDRAITFWTEDFGGGFPSDWVKIDSSGICPWTYTIDGSWGFYNGNEATSAADPMSSTTAANGFLICDNDSANHFTYGQPSGSTYEYLSSWFGTSSIDCSTHSSVVLRFEQFFRYNNSVSMWVEVSTDSSTWTKYEVSGGIANNTYSTDPDLVTLNISPIAGSEPNVYLRFGWNARVYFWCIDDISLSEAEPNDLVMEEGWWETGVLGNQYYKIPIGQASPVTFTGSISNNTGGTLNDIYMDVDLDDGSGSVFSGSSGTKNLTSTELDTFPVTSTWTPTETGTYTATYTAQITAATDGDLSNNELSDAFDVTSSIYGLDNLNDPSEAGGSISNWSGNTGEQFGIGNIYEVINDDEIYCLEIGIADDAENEGELIYGAVYYWSGSAWEFLELTDDHVVEASEIGQIITLPLNAPLSVSAGDQLAVVACHYGGTDASFMMGQSVPNQMVYGFDASVTWYWLSNPRAIIVRASFDDCGLGLQEGDIVSDFSLYPNPTSNELKLDLKFSTLSEPTIKVVDMSGKIVETVQYKNLKAGSHTLVLNTSNYEGGAYMIEVSTDQKTVRKKVIIR